MWGGLGKHTDLFTCIQTQVIRLLFGSANPCLCVDEWGGENWLNFALVCV